MNPDSPPDVRYPDIAVQLTGNDGNAMSIIAAVSGAMRRAKVERPQIEAFVNEAMSGNYDNVLATAMRWVDVS